MAYPTPPPAQPPSPQRDFHTTWIVLGAILIGVLVLCGGCLGVVGLGLMADTTEDADPGDSSDGRSSLTSTPTGPGPTPTDDASTTPTKRDDPEPRSERYWDTPRKIREGKAFEHDGFEIDAGWQVARETFGSPTIRGLSVTTVSGDRRTAQLTFTFYRGKQVLAEVSCTSQQMQEGESSAMDCYSLNDYPEGYDTVKVSDAW